MTFLVTGFDPFGGETINPAWEAVKALPADFMGHKIITLQIPTVFQKSVNTVIQGIEKENPDVILSIGQAGGRFTLSPERIAINLDDARIPDNENNQPIDTPIAEQGPAAYFTTLPVKAMVREVKEGGIPASVSNTAGTFVCNHVMYGVLDYIETKGLQKKAGFIHVPYLPNQVLSKPNMPFMDEASITKGLLLCIKGIIENPTDILSIGGEIS